MPPAQTDTKYRLRNNNMLYASNEDVYILEMQIEQDKPE